MTKVQKRRCDACSNVIGKETHLRLKRFIWDGIRVRLYDWGIVDTAPVDTGWRNRRIDICQECWDEVLDEITTRCADD